MMGGLAAVSVGTLYGSAHAFVGLLYGLKAFTCMLVAGNRYFEGVMVVGLGGSVLFYVMDRVEPVIRRLVEFLQTSDFGGVIFSRIRLEGTFPLEVVRYGLVPLPA